MKLALAVLVALASVHRAAGEDDQVRVRAGICEDRQCLTRTQVAFAPARINVQVFVRPHADNRSLVYGVVCDGMWVQESRVQLDGVESGPLFIGEYRDVGAGECQALAAVYRGGSEPISARSERMIVRAPASEPE